MDISAIKREFGRQHIGKHGVVGVGVGGPETLHVYVLDQAAADRVPAAFMGATVKVTITGPIVAAGGEL